MKRLALILFAAVAITAAAVAQTATPAPVSGSGIIPDAYRPILQDIANIAWTALIGFIAYYVKQKLGIDLTAERRDAFQIATTNAAGLMRNTGDMSKAVEYVADSVPDAVKHFGLTPRSIEEKIEAKVGILEAGGAVTPVMPGVVPRR